MSGGESSRGATKRAIKQRMAAEAAAIASLVQENRGVRFSEPREATPQPYEVMNSQNSNTKGKGKVDGSDDGKGKENRGVHSSEPPMSFQATPETDEVMSRQNSNPKGNGNGKGKCRRNTNGPKIVIFNRLGQPVGDNAAPLAHFLSKAAKGLVPLTVRSWFGNGLSADFKDLIWNHVKRYYIVDDCHRKLCFQKIAKYW